MTWEQKIEMIKLGNQGKQREMQDFVEPLLEEMDGQAKDMLFMSLELTDKNISQNKPFFQKLKSVMDNDKEDFGFRTGFRTGLRIEYFKLLLNH